LIPSIKLDTSESPWHSLDDPRRIEIGVFVFVYFEICVDCKDSAI